MSFQSSKITALRAFLIAILFACNAPNASMGQTEASGPTRLLNVWLGSARSEIARGLRRGRLELADGTLMSFDKWYRPQMREINLVMMTQLTPTFGLLWGLSSGEAGEKYRITPGLHLGFFFQEPVSERGTLSVQMTGMLGGRFQEERCTANFGTMGGVVPVNCRLAATHLPPEETLRYIVRKSGWQEFRASLAYEVRF